MSRELLTSQKNNSGILLDPRTKLAVLITIAVFILGGSYEGIMQYYIIVLAAIPLLLLSAARKWKGAVLYILILGGSLCLEMFGLSRLTGVANYIAVAIVGILHPGAHVGAGVETGLQQVIKGLNEVLTKDTPLHIALETMAGKGSELGRSFEELAAIYDGVVYSDKLRVCFDTCHTHDSGYDIRGNFDGVIDEFDHLIGKDQIAVFHINDSKNVRGAKKDRHANLGTGEIGFDALSYIVHHPDFEQIPKILETPYIPSPTKEKKSYAPYKYEIAMLRASQFDKNFPDNIIAENEN